MSKQSQFIQDHSLSKGVWYNRGGNVTTPQDIRDAGFTVSDEHQHAYNAETERVIEAYRQAQANRTPEQEAEHMFELRAAHGPGVEVVDVITGKRYTT